MTSAAVTYAVPTPYKGLTNYTEGDAEFFFGRERECRAIISSLKARRLTLLYGESGVGKSSALRAGVAALLEARARASFKEIDTPEFVHVVFSEWRDDSIAGMTNRIEDSIAEFCSESPGAHSARPLHEVIADAAERADAYLLLILDQFED